MADYTIGIDVGTQGTKAALMNTKGQIVAESFAPSRLIRPAPDQIEQDPDDLLSAGIASIRDVMEKAGCRPGEVAAVALAGQMAGIMGIGRDGQAVTPYDSWLDQRCGACWDDLREIGETKIIKLTGGPITYAHGPKVLWWKKFRPDQYRQIASFVQPASWLAMQLCGLDGSQAFIDHTYLHFSGFADTRQRIWSDELLQTSGVERNKMPRIVRPADIVGHVTQSMAEATGLLAGTPVAAGCGDTAASIFGAGVTQAGMAIDVAGTASVFGVAVDRFAPDTTNRTLLFAPSVLDGLYTPMAYINGGGLCLKWLRDEIFGDEEQAPSYRRLDEMAAQIAPGSDRLLFIPHFSGRVCPNDGVVRGSWIGLSWTHGRSHLFRSAIESFAYEYAMYLDILRRQLPDVAVSQVINVGGGAKSHLMQQIKADVLGIPWTAAAYSDTGLLGTGVLAGLSVGLFDDPVKTLQMINQQTEPVQPDMSRHQLYQPYRQAYQDALTALRPVYAALQEHQRKD
ncbi:MAG: xylulose kinase [Clostridia bacterium]|nr:xylulose kinase [Clostridia bacterium]